MCLMCEYYIGICSEVECVKAAKNRAANDAKLRDEYYESRSGTEYFLWKGYSNEPCKHIKADHGPECTVVKRTETEYGMLFEDCNCDNIDNEWVYY